MWVCSNPKPLVTLINLFSLTIIHWFFFNPWEWSVSICNRRPEGISKSQVCGHGPFFSLCRTIHRLCFGSCYFCCVLKGQQGKCFFWWGPLNIFTYIWHQVISRHNMCSFKSTSNPDKTIARTRSTGYIHVSTKQITNCICF